MKIGFGCVNLGSASHGRSRRADARLVEQAVDRGVTVFDTADVYGSGASERILGRALRRHRADVVIATKAGYVFRQRSTAEQSARKLTKGVLRAVRAGAGSWSAGATTGGSYARQNFSPDYLRAAVDASLRRLDTDYLDVFQLHGPTDVMPGLLTQMEDLITTGKVRRFGVGAESVAAAAAWSPVAGLDVVQLPFGVLDPEAATEIFPATRHDAVEIWARGVLGGGLLAAAGRGPRRDDPKWPLIEGLQGLARRFDVDVYHLAIGFVRAYSEVSTAVIGISSDDHLRRNLTLFAAPQLDDEVLAELLVLVRTNGGDRS